MTGEREQKRVGNSPGSEIELMARVRAIAGLSLAELTAQSGLSAATDLSREKGWMGQMLEQVLGASSGSLAQPDFPDLGIELKTIPVDRSGQPLESTWVASAYLLPEQQKNWLQSHVRAKLQRVLWLPVLAERGLPASERLLGLGLLWSPDAEQEILLRADYEEICDAIAMGGLEQLSARHGNYLQLRPKAANRRELTAALGPDGESVQTLPRGFYLRRSFTRRLLAANYA